MTQPRQGILLNRHDVTPLSTPKRSPIDLPAPLPRINSTDSSNSSDGSPSDSPPRKIRFAPLPDPRRAILLPEPGDISAALTETQDAAAAAPSATTGELIALTPVASTSGSGDSTVNGDDSDPRSESRSDLRPSAKKKKSKKWGKRLFGPLLKGGAKLDTAAPLGDSNGTSAHEVGLPLGRRQSTGSTEPSRRGRASLIGSPLTLTQSVEGEGGGTAAPVRQQRMLNGRVYGARQTLPSTTTQEPVFVEWGFGGTGAVTSGGSQYARLQSSNKLSLGTEATTADEDDGSGMAWVAKRRAAREEKARKEKEAALETERAKEVCLCILYSRGPIQISLDLQAAKEEEPAKSQDTDEANSQQSEDGGTRPQTPTPAPNTPPSTVPLSRRSTEGWASDAPPPPSLKSDHEEHHTVKTISIPGAHPRPHHARNQSIGSLKERTASHSSPPNSGRESEHGSTTEDDDEDSETELEEDIEEVCLCTNLASYI